MAAFDPVAKDLLFTRNDKTDPRLGEAVNALPAFSNHEDLRDTLSEASRTNSSAHRYTLVGYPDDEGIKNNGGRIGAKEGPDSVRRPLYKMTPALLNHERDFEIWDLGNLKPEGSLESRHETASRFALTALQSGSSWIAIGGGHDYGFAEASAYIKWCREKKIRPLVINFDAHLDVRPMDRGLTSGTPFFRMLEMEPEMDFAEIGIQSHCNSRAHFDWVRAKGARVLTQEEVEISGESFATMSLRLLEDWLIRPRPAFISIDIDGFSSAVAPGASQSWATGFMPHDFFPLLSVLRARLDIKVLGLYEVSPPLDQDARTAKLAAQIIHRVITEAV